MNKKNPHKLREFCLKNYKSDQIQNKNNKKAY